MKKITEHQVFEALTANQSIDENEGEFCYFLHMTEDGEILDSFHDADKSFTSVIPYADDYECIDDVYAKEVETDPDFMEIVADLTEQANVWLAGLDY